MLIKNQEPYTVNKSESLQDFYNRLKINSPELTIPSLGMVNDMEHFNVFKRFPYYSAEPSPYNRKDFYKISLIIGSGILYYQNKRLEVKHRALLFTNPHIPYSWESTSKTQEGYCCLFTDNFIHKRNENLGESIFWQIHDSPVIMIDAQQEQIFKALFCKMLAEMDGEYIHKYDLLRNYVQLMAHEALKVQPASTNFRQNNASVRLTSLFIELLERQFPIASTDHILELRTAHDFACRLSVHVNHLNHAVKKVTGKTTSAHISKRIGTEAIALLKHTEWNVAQIAYCLGFEYPGNFNIFFKRKMKCTPKSFRQL